MHKLSKILFEESYFADGFQQIKEKKLCGEQQGEKIH